MFGVGSRYEVRSAVLKNGVAAQVWDTEKNEIIEMGRHQEVFEDMAEELIIQTTNNGNMNDKDREFMRLSNDSRKEWIGIYMAMAFCALVGDLPRMKSMSKATLKALDNFKVKGRLGEQ